MVVRGLTPPFVLTKNITEVVVRYEPGLGAMVNPRLLHASAVIIIGEASISTKLGHHLIPTLGKRTTPDGFQKILGVSAVVKELANFAFYFVKVVVCCFHFG